MRRKISGTGINLPKPKKTRGQTLVEFALILPVLLVSLFIIIELARILHAWMALENGARTGIRYAVTGEYNPAFCTDSDADGYCDSLGEEPAARINSIHDAAWAGSSSIIRVGEGEVSPTDPSFFQITVCNPANLSSPASTFDIFQCGGGVEDPGDPGGEVSVILEFNHPVILPGLSSIVPELRLTARRDATVETFRLVQAGSGAPGSDPPDPGPPDPPPPPPPPPPDYDPCEYVTILDEIFHQQSDGTDQLWKFEMQFYNANEIDATLTNFFLEWSEADGDPTSALKLNRWSVPLPWKPRKSPDHLQ
jgi:hypothetical protein